MPHQLDIFGLTTNLSQGEAQEIRKRELRNLLTSYADEADVVVEIVQNAVDAIRAAHTDGLFASTETSPELTIVIGRRSGGDPHYLLVTENGIGMGPELAGKFATPGVTKNKRLGKTIGYKGVGASFYFAAANRISFSTQASTGVRTERTVSGAYSWIMSSHEPLFTVEDSFYFPEAVQDAVATSRGTSVYYELHSGLKPRSLSYLVHVSEDPEKELQHWASYLAAKTAIGQVEHFEVPNTKINIWLDNGEEVHKSTWSFGDYNLDQKTLGYPYPWQVFKIAKPADDIDSTPVERKYEHRRRHQAIQRRWIKADVLSLTPGIDFTQEEEALVTEYFVFGDFFFAYSASVLNEIHRRLGSQARTVRYGLRLASDGVAQGRPMEFDLTSNQGLGRQAHALLLFRGLELDTGRKIPADETILSVIRKITVRAMGNLSEYRWAMRQSDRGEPSVDLTAWRTKTKERISNSLTNNLFEMIGGNNPIIVDPESENDVIALFSSLVTSDQLKGISLLALSGYNRYDGLVDINTSRSEIVDTGDPFSVRDFDIDREGEMCVLEFKHLFESVLEDFESKRKRPQDIDVVVCWTLPELNVSDGTIEYTYGERNDFRQVYGMTHLWTDEGNSFKIPIISLKHFIAEKLFYLESDDPGIGTAKYRELLQQDKDASV